MNNPLSCGTLHTVLSRDPQIHNLLDTIAPEQLRAPFWTMIEQLKTSASATPLTRIWVGSSLDGTQCFGSSSVH